MESQKKHLYAEVDSVILFEEWNKNVHDDVLKRIQEGEAVLSC